MIKVHAHVGLATRGQGLPHGKVLSAEKSVATCRLVRDSRMETNALLHVFICTYARGLLRGCFELG